MSQQFDTENRARCSFCQQGSRSSWIDIPRPCPRCSAMPELQTMNRPGRLAFLGSILPELQAKSKIDALREIIGDLRCKEILSEQIAQAALETMIAREQFVCCEKGCGIAIVYARCAGIDRVLGAFARSEAGLDFGVEDTVPVHLIFLLVTPASQPAQHLRALQAISRYVISFRHEDS